MCGTAPSLLEAMHLKLCVLSFDVPVNRETTLNEAIYFEDARDLQKKITNMTPQEIENVKLRMEEIAYKEYTWKKIAGQYRREFEN
jgi:glycosyltransferase involved in cell wall biosynthesis